MPPLLDRLAGRLGKPGEAAAAARGGAGAPDHRRAAVVALAVMAAAALAIRLATAMAFPNVLWPDEIFQSLEQAHRIVFGRGVVPWEFREGARSWLLPGLLAGPMRLAPRGDLLHVRAAQLLLCALSLAPVAVAYATAARLRGLLAGVVAASAAALWFELIFFAPKALNEVVAAHVLLLGLHLDATARGFRSRVVAGVLLGVAIALRVHLAPAVLLALAVSAGRDARRWSAVVPGVAVALVLAGVLDLATWGAPFRSFLRTVAVNVVEGKASAFGTAPWTGYLRAMWGTWSWAAVVVVPLACAGARLRPSFAACALGVLATHTAFAHKEYRFIYPAIALVITLAAVGAGELVAWLRTRVRSSPAALATVVILAWGGASAARALSYETTAVDPADDPGTSRWTHARWGLDAMALARAKPDLCGVGVVLLPWWWTGGYTYLHRDVPIFLLQEERDGPATAGGFNAVIAPPEVVPNLREFGGWRCWREGACYGERAGPCRSVPAPEINERLVSGGE